MEKILLITLDFFPKIGGVSEYYFNLCEQLAKENHDSIVVLTENTKIQEYKNIKIPEYDFKIYRKDLSNGFIWPRWLLMFWHIWRVVKKEKIEMFWAGEVLPTGTAVYCLSKLLKIPYIVSCHGNDILRARKKWRKEKLAQRILQAAKWATANSNYTRGLAVDLGVENERVQVVYPGIQLKTQNSKLKTKEELIKKYNLENKKILLSVGRLVERKGFDNVIRALPKVWQEIPDLVYLIAGNGSDKERLGKLSQETLKQFNDLTIEQLSGRIIFLGQASMEDKEELFSLCDVFIMPARASADDVEGFGMVYLEAGSFGKAVIGGRGGGVSEAVVNGETGVLVDGQNVDEIAAAIIKLFEDDNFRKKLGDNGRRRVEQEFGWEKSVKKFRGLLNC